MAPRETDRTRSARTGPRPLTPAQVVCLAVLALHPHGERDAYRTLYRSGWHRTYLAYRQHVTNAYGRLGVHTRADAFRVLGERIARHGDPRGA
jgi:hypothetical protein